MLPRAQQGGPLKRCCVRWFSATQSLVDVFAVDSKGVEDIYQISVCKARTDDPSSWKTARFKAAKKTRIGSPCTMIMAQGSPLLVSLLDKGSNTARFSDFESIPYASLDSDAQQSAVSSIVSELLELDSVAQMKTKTPRVVSLDPVVELHQKFTYRPFSLLDRSVAMGTILSHVIDLHESSLDGVPHHLAEGLKGMHVAVTLSPEGGRKRRLTGIVTSISGFLRDHRERLMSLSVREDSKEYLRRAPDDELVIALVCKSKGFRSKIFEYCASQVSPIVALENSSIFSRFTQWRDINLAKINDATMMAPEVRRASVEREMQRLHEKYPFISPNSISSEESKLYQFGVFKAPRLLVGGRQSCEASEVGRSMKMHGLYHMDQACADLVVCGMVLGDTSPRELQRIQVLYDRIVKQLSQLGMKVREDRGLAPVPREVGIQKLVSEMATTIVIWFATKAFDNIKQISSAARIKAMCMHTRDETSEGSDRHVVSQFVESDTVFKSDALLQCASMNIASGICGKLGHVPFCLKEEDGDNIYPTSAAVGTDVSRYEQSLASRTDLAVGVLYDLPAGILLDTAASEIKGECVPERMWRTLLQRDDIKPGAIVIHRDGRFQASELEAIRAIASDETERPFLLAEITKIGGRVPRIYGRALNTVVQPTSGSYVLLGTNEALLITNPKRVGRGTASPVLVTLKSVINVDSSVPPLVLLAAALQSVYRLTKVHFGSLWQAPRIPLTTFGPDKAAYTLAAAGVKDEREGMVRNFNAQQFWL